MAPGRRSRRERVSAAFDAFHAAVARALGAAELQREAAVRAQAEAMFELWLRREGVAAVRADPSMAPAFRSALLAAAVERAERDHRAGLSGWLPDGPRALADVVADAAHGPAGARGTAWLDEVVGAADPTASGPELLRNEGVKDYPELWRIGAGHLDIGDAFPVAVPLLDEAHLRIDSVPESRPAAEALVEQLLMRMLACFRPGILTVDVWDVGQYGLMPALYPLARTGLVTSHDPNRLGDLLDELSERIRKVHSRVLVGGFPSLRAHAAHEGRRSEPWVVVVLAGNRTALPEDQQRQLQRIARSGLACGIHLVMLDVPVTVAATVETVRFTRAGVRCSMTGPHVRVDPDPPLPRQQVTDACSAISRAHEAWRAKVSTFADLLPQDREGTQSSRSGVRAPIGFTDGMHVELALDDASPHALIGGPSGSGKTNLLLAMIGSMAARYGPDELHFYLLDFKEGVSFAQFAPGRRDASWLPHARLIGINVNTDREFGLALLQFLADEMRRRAEAAKSFEVTKLEELRRADPQGHWPRIVAVVDEFQYLFAEKDQVTRQATALLEDVARRGRSQGIHLVFASQDVSGIEAFWGRPAIFEQFVLRIALPRARRVLANLNDAALALPRWHAIVNHESGIGHGNEIARIPDAGAGSDLDEVQRAAYERYAGPPPRLFDGARSPAVRDLLAGLPAGGTPRALLGQVIDMAGSAAAVELPDAPGRNVAVLASASGEGLRVMGAAAASLAATAPPEARFVVAPLVGGLPAAALAGREVETVGLDGIRARIEDLAREVKERVASGDRRPVFVLLLGADTADPLLERSGTEALRTVLRFGPEVGLHVVGWWRSATRLRQLLTLSAGVDDVGAWIGLDVQGSELGALAPGLGTTWAPRPGRGLFFDRATHARPEVVIVPGPLEEGA
ncbi:FtsK/SpoIIIE domain-containing protein [Pseudonocardia yuanmonensis]|uniref:FtsK/SpoIIIE domain-containing protein n=1 Tax=Pseudonocardia yuanmonensis TaxID=1095914 RepID=A0ABP8VX45_9PSEU